MASLKLNCLMCGAPSPSDAANCGHCGARLVAAACPSCFGAIFQGSKFCPHCGDRTDRAAGSTTQLPCPGCKTPLEDVTIGETSVHECGGCHGLWIDATTFDQICSDREKQSAVLGSASETFKPGQKSFDPKIRYVPCPACKGLMHRVNFAKCSGIVVDVCRGHGTWFDKDELHHIVQFIRTGGLDLSREREKLELESARRKLQSARDATVFEPVYERKYAMQEPDLFAIAGSILSALRKL